MCNLVYWRSHGWRTRGKKLVRNVDLWEKVFLPPHCEVARVSDTAVVLRDAVKQRDILRDAIRSARTTTNPPSTPTPEVTLPVSVSSPAASTSSISANSQASVNYKSTAASTAVSVASASGSPPPQVHTPTPPTATPVLTGDGTTHVVFNCIII